MTIIEKLINQTNVVDGHWLWKGCRYKNGYGYLRYKGQKWLVHRLSLIVFRGLDLTGKQVNHIVACPHKHCFHPDHVYAGDQKQNMADRWNGHVKKTKLQKNAEYYSRHNQHRKNFGRT